MRPEDYAPTAIGGHRHALPLAVQGLCLDTAQGNRILHDVTFDIAAGERVGIIGPNGVGKSSLLKCLYRFQRPNEGCVLLDGGDIWTQPPVAVARRIAAVLQEYPADFAFTVRQVVQMGRIPHQKGFQRNGHADMERARAALEALGLRALEKRQFASLSGGEKQRVMVARALVQEPQLLILDEPTNHLDIRYQLDVLSLVGRLGITVISTIHDLNLAAAYFDRLLLMQGGRIVADGPPDQVLAGPNLQQAFEVDAVVDAHPLHGRPRITYRHQLS